jgi:hypothetical protein
MTTRRALVSEIPADDPIARHLTDETTLIPHGSTRIVPVGMA